MKHLSFSPLIVVALSVSSFSQPTIPSGPSVLVLGGEYHLASCPRLVGQPPKTVSLANAMRDGLGPCKACTPNSKDRAIGAFAVEHAIAIGKEFERKRAVEDAEREKARVAADRERARSRAAADAKRAADELKRAEGPLTRLTETQIRGFAAEAAKRSNNDPGVFAASVMSAVTKIAPDIKGPVVIEQSGALEIFILGPASYFLATARERVRKFEPVDASLPWPRGVRIVVSPKQIDAPDIEKLVVQRNGAVVAQLGSTLAPQELVTAMNAKRVIHRGEIAFPTAAFEPGAGVTVTITAIPASGSNIVRRLNSLELRRIQ